MKILLVEDDTALRCALEELLCQEGYEVINASNVCLARSAMNSEVDLIMLDVGLPDGDGESLCRQWRDDGMQTPVLFLTAEDAYGNALSHTLVVTLTVEEPIPEMELKPEEETEKMSVGTIVLIVLCVAMAAGLAVQGTILTKKIHKLEEVRL